MHEIKLDNVEVLWYGHASFRITSGEKFIYVDPYVLPDDVDKADVILITHEHFDHCDTNNTNDLKKANTEIIAPSGSVKKLGYGKPVKAGQNTNLSGVRIESVEAYNTNKFRSPGNPFHPRGLGVGFVVTVDGKRIYHAGDTDNIEEMSSLRGIDVGLLPIGGTYTMTAAEAAEAAKIIKPKYLVPMHYNSDKYGVAGINANPVDVAKALVGKGIVVNILAPLV